MIYSTTIGIRMRIGLPSHNKKIYNLINDLQLESGYEESISRDRLKC